MTCNNPPALEKRNIIAETRADGSTILRSPRALPAAAPRTGAWLHQWAKARPTQVALAERSGEGWRELDYAELLEQVRAVAAALVDRGLQSGGRIAFLSGNGVDHAILALAAQYVGATSVPVAEQYALLLEAQARLTFVLERVRPQLIFAEDARRLSRALCLPQIENVEVVASHTAAAGRRVTPFSALLGGRADADLDVLHGTVGHDTVAKIIFTSGSSGDPKGVVTTQGMLCINQAQIATAWPFLSVRPPRLLDWLPWNHVFGGSQNVNLSLAHGGSFYIDHGKPTAASFAETLRNIREHPGSLSFNVPVGYAMLVEAAENDASLRRSFFSDLDLIFYAGSSLPRPVWERLERFAIAESGRLPLMATSCGMTETAPACIMVHEPTGRPGIVGVPLPGVEAKLIPHDGPRYELRVRGPNIMPGYFEDPARTAEAFDGEGYLITGDAVCFADADTISVGLAFDGRISEDFKLDTSSWVQAGRLRLDALGHLSGIARDVVVCGHDRSEIGLLIFPAMEPLDRSNGAVIDAALQVKIEAALRVMNKESTRSSKRIARVIVLTEPPSLAGREITDKGSLNIRRVLVRRSALVDRLYDNDDLALVRV